MNYIPSIAELEELGYNFHAPPGRKVHLRTVSDAEIMDRLRKEENPLYKYGFDAGGLMQTRANTLLPAQFFQVVDPAVFEARQRPLVATQIFPESRVGDWTTETYSAGIMEYTGVTQPYSDFSDTPAVNANMNWQQVSNFLYQTFMQVGELEQARSQAAGFNLTTAHQTAAARVLAKTENSIYLLGIEGLSVYGILNFPTLPASENPLPWTPPGGGGPVTRWADKDAIAIYNDILFLFGTIANRDEGLVDENTTFKLLVSPLANTALKKITRSADNLAQRPVIEMLRETLPNLQIIMVPELKAAAGEGETVMLIGELEGGRGTGGLYFSEKIKTHPPFIKHSMSQQKWSSGTFGAIIYEPYLIATMTGV